jgi:hypothetical protein
VPIAPDLLFTAADLPGFVLHVEICEDMWVPVPPSAEAALAGATVLANLSGSPITVGRAEDRKLLARSASSRCLAAYAYAAAGEGESSTDLAWDGQTMIYENGVLLAESERFPKGERRSVATTPPGSGPSATSGSGSTRRRPTSGCAARSSGSRSCPPTRPAWSSTASRPTTSRSPGWSSGCAPSASRRSSSGCPAGSTPPTR